MPVPAGGPVVANPDLLATVEDLQALLGTVDEAKALLLLQAATAAVQTAAGGQRILEVVDDTATLDLDEYDGGPYLVLPQWPVTAVGAVTVGGTVVADVTAQLSRGRLWRSMGWRSATLPYYDMPSHVTVVYTHGYAVGDQRLQLARSATLMLAAGAYSNPGTGVVREQIDDYAVQYAAASATLEATAGMAGALRRQYGRPSSSVRLVTR